MDFFFDRSLLRWKEALVPGVGGSAGMGGRTGEEGRERGRKATTRSNFTVSLPLSTARELDTQKMAAKLTLTHYNTPFRADLLRCGCRKGSTLSRVASQIVFPDPSFSPLFPKVTLPLIPHLNCSIGPLTSSITLLLPDFHPFSP